MPNFLAIILSSSKLPTVESTGGGGFRDPAYLSLLGSSVNLTELAILTSSLSTLCPRLLLVLRIKDLHLLRDNVILVSLFNIFPLSSAALGRQELPLKIPELPYKLAMAVRQSKSYHTPPHALLLWTCSRAIRMDLCYNTISIVRDTTFLKK